MAPLEVRFKCKIGSHLSYPISRSLLIEHLSDAIDSLDISLAFFSYKAPRQGEVRPNHKLVEVTSPTIHFAEWRLFVFPVPRQFCKASKSLLVSTGLPKISDWLLSPKNESWFITGHRFTALYSSELDSLVYDRKD